jgi:hypothetical protein
MRISRILALVTVLLVFAIPAWAGDEVPIKGTVTGGHGPVAPAGCDGDALWRFESSGKGQMSHLGRVDYQLTHCTYFVPMSGIVFRDGTITFTAANGDTLVIAQTGTAGVVGDPAAPDGWTMDGEWTVVDGTGRFAHATGTGSIVGFGDVPGGDTVFGLRDGMAKFNLAGDIAYAASDRSDR